MPPRSPTVPLRAEDLAVLANLAEARLADEHDHEHRRPHLVRVRVVDDEVELGWLRLAPDRHPVDELAGAVAPADWCALGVAATGLAHPLDGPAEAVRVRTVHLVGRDGAWASRWCPLDPSDGGGDGCTGPADGSRRPTGRLDDACRRALDLPTSPPPCDTGRLWAVQWLDAVVELAAGAGGTPARAGRWTSIAELHPAVPALRGGGTGGGPPSPVQLGRMAQQLTEWRDWALLRRACAAGVWPTPEVEADVAGWLDEGAFSRWVLGAYPELHDLRALAADLLPAAVARDVETALSVAGVTDR